LSSNQYAPGYCVLICKKHVREPYELPPDECAQFFADMMRVGRALETIYHPIKMNFQLLGNAVPHTHCHIIPRYYGDPRPGMPLDPMMNVKRLASIDEYMEQGKAIRAALSSKA